MRTSHPRSRTALAAALAVVLGLSVSACGNNDAATGTDGRVAEVDATPKPVAQIAALTGRATEVTLDAGFLAGLRKLGLTPGPIGTASVSAAGVARFPITGGTATYYKPGTADPYVQGLIMHDGSGLSLTDGATRVELTNFVVDPGKSVLTGDVSANGKTVVDDAPLFFLDGSTLQPLRMEGPRTAVLQGTTVSLTKTAADLLDTTYKTTALTEFFKVGVAKISLTVPA